MYVFWGMGICVVKRRRLEFSRLRKFHHVIIIFEQLGFAKEKEVKGAMENDRAKEKAGFVAGKHISSRSDWWWQAWAKRANKSWSGDGDGSSSPSTKE